MAHYESLDPAVAVEEETLRDYKVEDFYPVRLGDVFQERYSVIGKLGYGSASTVWLCRDLRGEQTYVALKVYINRSKVHRELPLYDHINSLDPQAAGFDCIRRLLDSFEISGPNGNHICLVHQALGMDFHEVRQLTRNKMLDPELVRPSFRNVARGLYFLHTTANVIHTDIQPRNILLGVLDNAAFIRVEKAATEFPTPRKELSTRTIYLSQPMPLTRGTPLLCDLGEARFDGSSNTDLIMPDVYRAPEVILGMPWSYPVDIWGFAMTLWDLFQPKRLFSPHHGDGRYSEHHHLAQMISIMGSPPLEFLQRSEKSQQFWDKQGNWIGEAPIPVASLETAEKRLQGDEKELFLNYMRKLLKWKPEDREDAAGAYADEWLLADLFESGDIVRE